LITKEEKSMLRPVARGISPKMVVIARLLIK
jgi:hypothetical protein